MSSCSEKDVELEDDYDYGDDVSIIDRSEVVDWSTIIIKIFLGLLFIGFATGCIIYSIVTSKDEIEPASMNSSFFIYNISQHCHNGTLTWRNRTGSDVNDYDTISTGITWLQDASRQRIFHRIGIGHNDDDWQVSHYVFILGLRRIPMVRTESFSIEGEETKVNYFEGEPGKNITIEGLHPNIVRAYSVPNNTFVYGWLYFFSQTNDSAGLYQKEYWYPEMKAGISDEGVFEEIPSSCYKSST